MLVPNKSNTKKIRTLKKQRVAIVKPLVERVMTVEEFDEKTESDFDNSSATDFESLFGSMFEDDNLSEDVDSDIDRSMATTRAKAKGKVVIFSKKGKSK